MKKTIRLTENELKGVIMESVKNVLNEDYTPHTKAVNSLRQYDKRSADEYQDIPWKIKDGIDCLSWLLPGNIDMRHIGNYQRVSPEIVKAIQTLKTNKDMVIDAVMDTVSQFHHYNSGTRNPNLTSQIDNDITNGVSLQDRYKDYTGYGGSEYDFDRKYDNEEY